MISNCVYNFVLNDLLMNFLSSWDHLSPEESYFYDKNMLTKGDEQFKSMELNTFNNFPFVLFACEQ